MIGFGYIPKNNSDWKRVMAWNRKEVGNLLMVGAGIISAIQTAIFGKWVDAKIAGNDSMALAVSWLGVASTLTLSLAWIVSRFYMGRLLTGRDRLDWMIGISIIFVFVAIEAGWIFAVVAG